MTNSEGDPSPDALEHSEVGIIKPEPEPKPEPENVIQAVVRAEVRRAFFSGPLPPPEALDRYNEIVPGAADRIIKLAEDQQKHRHQQEKTVIESNTQNATSGQRYAFWLAVLVIASANVFAYAGWPIWAFVLIVYGITALASVFLVGKRTQHKELQEKRSALEAGTSEKNKEEPAAGG